MTSKENQEQEVEPQTASVKIQFLLRPEEVERIERYKVVRETIHIAARRLLLTYLEELKQMHRAPAYTNRYDQKQDDSK